MPASRFRVGAPACDRSHDFLDGVFQERQTRAGAALVQHHGHLATLGLEVTHQQRDALGLGYEDGLARDLAKVEGHTRAQLGNQILDVYDSDHRVEVLLAQREA